MIDQEPVRSILRDMRRVVVAFSGGVDSAVLLAVAVSELHDDVLAVTGSSPSVAAGEIEIATEIAKQIGARHNIIETREFENPNYRANPANRCFYCKHELFERLNTIASDGEYHFVADGFNADDGKTPLDRRPGHEAAKQLGVRSPLAEAGLGKAAIRELARYFNLPVWNKPATPCLSSRVPYGNRIEIGDLRKIDLAERYLRALGYELVRVRHFGATAKIEVPAAQIAALRAVEERVKAALVKIGYTRVEIDARGYRTGSLNETAIASFD